LRLPPWEAESDRIRSGLGFSAMGLVRRPRGDLYSWTRERLGVESGKVEERRQGWMIYTKL
jgi:hypothetical protein